MTRREVLMKCIPVKCEVWRLWMIAVETNGGQFKYLCDGGCWLLLGALGIKLGCDIWWWEW